MERTSSVGHQGPAEDRKGIPTVMFLHGRGSDEHSAAKVSDVFAGTSVIAPRGSLQDGPGYAWFRNHSPGVADGPSLIEQVKLLEAWIDSHALGENLWLCGFSNGAAMSAALLLSRPKRYSGALLLSGPIVSEHPWPPDCLHGIPVLLIRGVDDRMIPAELMLESAKYFDGPSGARASIITVPGGHEISQHALNVMKAWFTTQNKWPRLSTALSPPDPEIV
jgi:phospholipase/carboxylesterase